VRRAAGQAVWLLRLLVTGSLVGLVVLALIGFRLSQGPVDLPWVARMIERESPLGEGRIEVAAAQLAWRGWRSARSSPIELRLSGLNVLDAAGTPRMLLPDATAQFSLRALLAGRITPVALVFDGLSLSLRRSAGGAVRLDLGQPDQAATAGGEALDAAALLAALSRLVLRNTTLAIRDEASGLDATLSAGRLLVTRGEEGLNATGSGLLALGGAAMPVSFALEPPRPEEGGRIRVDLPQLHAQALAGLIPPGLDAPLSLSAEATLAPAGGIAAVRGVLRAAEGRLPLPTGGSVAIEQAEAVFAAGPDLLPSGRVVARLSPGPLGLAAPPLLAADVAIRAAAEGGVAGDVEVRLDRMSLQGLLLLWPETLVANARTWIAGQIERGMMRDGVIRLSLAAPSPSAPPVIVDASGEARVEQLEVHWFRPLPPVEDGGGMLRFGSAEVTIDVTDGRIGAEGLTTTGGRLRFHNLDAAETEFLAEIRLGLAGEVEALLALLQHPHIALLDRRPLPVQGATGRFAGTLGVDFPLVEAPAPEDFRVSAEVELSGLRIPAVAPGQRLEAGEFRIDLTERGLTAAGSARVGDTPAQISVGLDFADGPPTQVMETLRVEGRVAAASLLRAMPAVSALGPRGQADVSLLLEARRGGRTDVAIRADLGRMALAVPALGWSKPAGRPGLVETVLRLDGPRLVGTELFRASAPDLALAGRIGFGTGGRLQRVDLTEARLFDTRAAGEVTPPARGGAPWRIALRGPVLDLAPILAAQDAEADGADRPPLSLALRFDRVLLGPERLIHRLDGQVATGQRGTVAEARLSGRTAEDGGGFDIRVTPRGGGRDVTIEAADAGALLAAFGISGAIERGRLALSARWQGEGAGQPVSGTATLDDFAVRDAPAIGRFLQGITVIGLIDLARSQHLSFTRAIVPFTLSPGTLALGEARAYSTSLGVTMTGRVDRRRETLDLSGTVVPAYLLNTLPGRLPLIGRLFSLEQGGGVMAVAWRARGPRAEPEVTVNPLSALTPGVLRGLFGQAPGQGAGPP